MADRQMITVDGNEACASVAFRTSEVVAIYPITPSSTMGELAEQWASEGAKNIWGLVPEVTEMQSEGGAAGAVHGALQAGALSTTFTASQGLLLMIPNMYKIAGELTSFCMHVSARTVATHALSIFGDHSDVMACRQTGFAMLCSGSVQEAQDMAAIGQSATLTSRVPFLHFFDGFRTSHEVAKIAALSDDDIRALIDEERVAAHRDRALRPDAPVVRGTSQNPDTFFQAQEARNPYYDACPGLVAQAMERFGEVTGRNYALFDYVGHPEAEKVVVMMGSGAETAHKTVDWLLRHGEKVGLIKVRLYRPFSVEAFVAALPATVKGIAVLDRTKEPGAVGEPLYQDVVAALYEAKMRKLTRFESDPLVIGGRYGLASKEFTPPMVRAVFEELAEPAPKRHFTVGIHDDVTHLSLPVDVHFRMDARSLKRAVFFGLGADGTVGANKNSIKIIADNTDQYAQAYFVYDSKKSGAVTISHLRFSPKPIQSPYLLYEADFLACHHFIFLEKFDVMRYACHGGTFLLNSHFDKDEVWARLPRSVQQAIMDKELNFYVIDAQKVAKETGMGNRINTIMQTCFFKLMDVIPPEVAVAEIKTAIEKTYGRKSASVVQKNFAAVDAALAHLQQVPVHGLARADHDIPPPVPADAPDFVREVTAMMLANRGDLLPVSAFPVDGTWPVGTAKYEKRNIAHEIPVWEPSLCIQCNKCVMVCPHAAIRAKTVEPALLADRPASFKSMPYKGGDFRGTEYLLQVAPEDCTGCTLCVKVCPGVDKADPKRLSLAMVPKHGLVEPERENFDYFLNLPEIDRTKLKGINVKSSQFLQPLFEFSGACLGCGETPYVKLVTQLWGDRALVANATGCSSIFGGNLPTTPYACNSDGRGPTWSNSLFEDNAEFGLGFRLAVDQHKAQAKLLVALLADKLPEKLVAELLHSTQITDLAVAQQRARVVDLRRILSGVPTAEARRLEFLADYLVDKVVWIVGGDGWAYDIGFGGLDHVLASGRNVNILVMDTEVYSNTGGQQSKATPIGASAKFASNGKSLPKKDLGLMALSYGNVYTASVAFGSKDNQTVKAMMDAVSYDGVSLIIAYSHCIAHGYDMGDALTQQKLAVETGYWPLYRFDPRKMGTAEGPLTLDCEEPKVALADYMANEDRFKSVEQANPERYKVMLADAQVEIRRRHDILKRIAGVGDATKKAAE
ncbi:MAG: pyruvate:ferredoxin (flavodoxin) oxidoreductase [Alphaproteobacteria bacterium]|nr:pyruvate:ferredoxin (flavodoxin) oxidoreductase [Alphaproteobacteria bacterium]